MPTTPTPGFWESVLRATANGGLFGYAPNVAAAGDATTPLDAGSSTAPSWMDRYNQNLALQNQRDQAGKTQYPTSTMLAGLFGNALSPANRLLPMSAKPSAAELSANLTPFLQQSFLGDPRPSRPLMPFWQPQGQQQ